MPCRKLGSRYLFVCVFVSCLGGLAQQFAVDHVFLGYTRSALAVPHGLTTHVQTLVPGARHTSDVQTSVSGAGKVCHASTVASAVIVVIHECNIWYTLCSQHV